ncbi:MAG: NtaA/DmoA family FMN-dependent monooxygenase [Tomitella sp.]|nr:NtaA/DmoA family FMN-dependent monooxygenase [Tomitella sp.]
MTNTPDSPRQITLSAFTMGCSGHQSLGTWALPGEKSRHYNTLGYWTDLARLLDRGGFDTLFIADVLGVYDVYGDSPDAALRSGAQVPLIDPLPALAAMAAVTENLGFGATVATTYERPYAFARTMSSLDHLTGGRVGWNIVTSYLESAARNLGLDSQVAHDKRYEIADEFMDVCYKLWEGSWEDDAVVLDERSQLYTDPDKVHPIEHHGEYFDVPGIALTEPSPQRTPVLFQAGASPRGIEFAGKHAELSFVVGDTPESVRTTVDRIRASGAEKGRSRDDLKVLAGVAVVVAETDHAARALLDQYEAAGNAEGGLTLFGGWTGLDLAKIDSTVPMDSTGGDAIRSATAMFGAKDWTAEELGQYIAVGGFTPVIVGDPQTVTDELERWIDVAGIDGFNLTSIHMPHSYESFIELVVPELRKRGRLRDGPAEGDTLREKLGFGGPHLQNHRAAEIRHAREKILAD